MSKSAFQEYSPGALIRNGGRTYAVEERISRGKLGYVFSCRDDAGEPRVLQVLWPFSRSYENVRERWTEQAGELSRLDHPGLLALFDGFEHEGCFHLVHEPGERRLDHELESPGWDGRRALFDVAGPVLGALDAAHRAGYTHRNLHPRNVFRAASGAVKLSDLAVDTLLGKVDVLNTKISRWLVPPEYLSPTECGPMDHRVDIYQAGLLLLCVLRGRVTQYSFEEISLGAPAKDAEELASEAGEALARALRPRVEERYGSALELWDALNGSWDSEHRKLNGPASCRSRRPAASLRPQPSSPAGQTRGGLGD
jgi:serine/threonine protein kinase